MRPPILLLNLTYFPRYFAPAILKLLFIIDFLSFSIFHHCSFCKLIFAILLIRFLKRIPVHFLKVKRRQKTLRHNLWIFCFFSESPLGQLLLRYTLKAYNSTAAHNTFIYSLHKSIPLIETRTSCSLSTNHAQNFFLPTLKQWSFFFVYIVTLFQEKPWSLCSLQSISCSSIVSFHSAEACQTKKCFLPLPMTFPSLFTLLKIKGNCCFLFF